MKLPKILTLRTLVLIQIALACTLYAVKTAYQRRVVEVEVKGNCKVYGSNCGQALRDLTSQHPMSNKFSLRGKGEIPEYIQWRSIKLNYDRDKKTLFYEYIESDLTTLNWDKFRLDGVNDDFISLYAAENNARKAARVAGCRLTVLE